MRDTADKYKSKKHHQQQQQQIKKVASIDE